jgi:hypothetical protein
VNKHGQQQIGAQKYQSNRHPHDQEMGKAQESMRGVNNQQPLLT